MLFKRLLGVAALRLSTRNGDSYGPVRRGPFATWRSVTLVELKHYAQVEGYQPCSQT